MFGRYVYKTSSGQYRFRIRVPAHLAAQVGAPEIRKSLGTDSLELAQIKAAQLAALYKLEFLKMRPSRKPTATKQNGSRLAQRKTAGEETFSTELITTFIAPDGSIRFEADYGGDKAQEIEATTALLRQYNRVLADARSAPERSAPTKAPLLSEATEAFLLEKASGGDPLKPRSLEEYRTSLRVFLELHGDCSIFEATRGSVVKAAEAYKKLPPYYTKKPEYRNMPLAQLVDLKTEGMSANSYSKFAVRISMVFKYCVDWLQLPTNPAAGLVPRKVSRDSGERNVFDDRHLKALFESEFFINRRFESKPFKYWVPMIALFTGARISEICQLRTQDVVNEKGLLCSGSMIPDTNVGGNIATINEVSDDQKATFFFS